MGAEQALGPEVRETESEDPAGAGIVEAQVRPPASQQISREVAMRVKCSSALFPTPSS